MGLEPQSTGLFLVLMGAFCVLLGCVAVARQVAVRVLAAALAFVPAMLFGVAAVNKYYDYYQTWGSAAADLTATGLGNVPQLPPATRGSSSPRSSAGSPRARQPPSRAKRSASPCTAASAT